MLPVASGKGGVGKSLVAANLAIGIAQSGKSTLLVDLDLGGSNLHTILGMRGLAHGIGTYLSGKSRSIDGIVYPTEYANLQFIPGDGEVPGMANVTSGQKNKLLRRLNGLDFDYVIMDLGSGSTFTTVDFFLASPRGIVVTTPSLTAILNAYLFLKNCVFRLLLRSFDRKSPASGRMTKLKASPQEMQRLYIPNLVEELNAIDPAGGERFKRSLADFHPAIVLNLLEDPRDAGKAGKIRRSCTQYLGVDVDHLGVVYRDVLQTTALASGLPILVYKPQSVLSRAIVRIADKILESEWNEELYMFETVDEGYQTAESEADIDFSDKVASMQDLLDSGTLSQGDLVETIRTQQYEIGRLRRENVFLKKKIVDASEAGFDV